MHRGQMVALEIVIHVSFPVALHVVGAALEKLHLLEPETLRLLGKFAQALQQGLSIGIEVYENQVEPFLGAYSLKREVFGPEILHAFDLCCTYQLSIEPVSPPVVSAAE